MRKRVGIYGATEEALQLLPLLAANPELEIGAVYAPDAEAVRRRLRDSDPAAAGKLTGDARALCDDPALYAVIDAGSGGQDFASLYPAVAERGVQIVTPLTARLLWAYGASSDDRKSELLQALHEIVESYNLTIDADELFRRMLEIALGVTGADGGSMMLLDPDAGELRVRMAVGLEPELWEKIRVPLGVGIAGKVAAEGRSLRLRGKADRQAFRIVRERLDVESALCVPLIHEGRTLGVLNLHHATRADAFSDADLEFTEQLAQLDAQIIVRSQEHAALRSQAARYAAARAVHTTLGGRAPLAQRLTQLCRLVAERAGGGIATVYLLDADAQELRLAATSLEGGGFGGDYRVAFGQGIDGGVARSRQPALLRGSDGKVAYASLPLVAGDALAGVLAVQSGTEAPDEEMLLEMASAAAEEIADAEREARIAARATKVGAINEMGIRMVSERDTNEVLRLATSAAAMVLEADHALLRLQDEETGHYVIRSYFGSADGPLQERLFRLDKSVSVDAIKRRSPVLVRDVGADDRLSEFDADVHSLIAAPLKREGRVIGTLAIYDKVATDRFTTGAFNDEDVDLFSNFVSYTERAVANALFYAHARQFDSFDEETGLPNASYLGQRLHEEVARSEGRPGSLAVAVCTVENLEELEAATSAERGRRVVQCTVKALRERLREFDVLGRTDRGEFTIVLPDPGAAPRDRILDLARAVADEIANDDALNEPVRIALAFGYAVVPDDGHDRDTLLAHAREPRIRLV
jgi:GAF domain-containing protein